MACAGAEPKFFGPLTFPDPPPPTLPFDFAPWEDGPISCIFCTAQFNLATDKNYLLAHLYGTHKLVIADVDFLASWKGYFDYWRIRFSQIPIDSVCVIYSHEGESYHLLSEVHPEDLELRRGLMSKRLEWVLECQKKDREERSYGRECLFCRYEERGTRADYLTHLSYQHNLQLGRPDNLVFVDKLIDKIEDKLRKLDCIYCDHNFRDRETLKEHMRKKIHKRINPKNKEYDRFYVKSYLEGGGSGDVEDNEVDDAWSQWREEGSDWSDWKEEPSPIVCLFCTFSCRGWDDILSHMNELHKFSYRFVMGSYNFYEQIKIVNFIRREIHILRCYECKLKCADRDSLTQHLAMATHCTIPDRSDWDHPEFFFPTYENDTFLSMIEDNEDDPIARLTDRMESECIVTGNSQQN